MFCSTQPRGQTELHKRGGESHARSPVAARVFLAVAHLTWSCRANLLIFVQSSTINVISVSKEYPSKVPVVFTIEINFVEVAVL